MIDDNANKFTIRILIYRKYIIGHELLWICDLVIAIFFSLSLGAEQIHQRV